MSLLLCLYHGDAGHSRRAANHPGYEAARIKVFRRRLDPKTFIAMHGVHDVNHSIRSVKILGDTHW
jgi:hypothetical protein